MCTICDECLGPSYECDMEGFRFEVENDDAMISMQEIA